MRDRIRDAFDQIQAEEPLKARTKDFLARKTASYTRVRPRRLMRAVPALACFALLLLGGHWLYFTPTAAISIDINPSLELGVNRFDKVISVDGRNSDGTSVGSCPRGQIYGLHRGGRADPAPVRQWRRCSPKMRSWRSRDRDGRCAVRAHAGGSRILHPRKRRIPTATSADTEEAEQALRWGFRAANTGRLRALSGGRSERHGR